MTRNPAHYTYKKSSTSQYSNNYSVKIQPAFCSQTLGGHSFGISDTDCISTTNKAIVYYQMGSSFSFVIPQSLTIDSIIFDALDSSLSPTESCLRENSKCWTLNPDKTLSINSLNPNPPGMWSIFTIQTEEWKSTFGSPLFRFSYSDTLSNTSGVGSLIIKNWVFQNFFYGFNTFIELINGHGKVSISGTTFDKFSNWGSIIRDTFEYPKSLNYVQAGLATSTAATYRDSMFTSNLYQSKYSVKPSSACEDSSWASIKIEFSIFQNFNYMKNSGHTYHKVDVNSQMKYQGIILNLSNFYGTVAFSNNQMQYMRFAYATCEDIYISQATADSADLWGTPSILQAKTLIYINVKYSSVEIDGNTFSNWNSLLGLIYLRRSSSYTSSILINGNTFTRNSAIIGTNAIKLYLFTSVKYNDLFSSSNMICSGVQISNNNFQQNIGCFSTVGAVQAIWYTDGDDTDPSTQTNHYSTPKPMSKTESDNLSIEGIINFTTQNMVTLPNSLISIDTNKFMMTNNIFNQNFAGMQSDIVELINIRRLFIVSDTYTANTGIFKEAMDKYGSIISSGSNFGTSNNPGAWAFSYYGLAANNQNFSFIFTSTTIQNFYPVAPLVIDGSLYISTTGLTFKNNAMQELKTYLVTSFYPSAAITILRSQGNLYLNSLTVQDYKGFDMTNLGSILDASSFMNIQVLGPPDRDSNGVPNSLPTFPALWIDYAFKNKMINFATPSSTNSANTTDFQNYFKYFEMKSLTIKNITHYNPGVDMPMFIEIKSDVAKWVIGTFTIQDVDLILGTTGMMRFSTYADLTISDGTVSRINVNAFSLKFGDFSYVGTTGGVFAFNQISSNSSHIFVAYAISNIVFDTIYANKGGAFYFGTKAGIATYQPISVTLDGLTLK